MIELLAGGAALASVLAYAASLAFATRPWPAIAFAGLGLFLAFTFSVIESLAALPSDTVRLAFADAALVEAYAIVICVEALVAGAVLWHSTSRKPLLRNTLLFLPLPVTTGALLVLTQFSIVYGPRIDLVLLGWAGLFSGMVALCCVYIWARFLRARASEFLLELCLFLRLLAILFATSMISVQLHRPAPILAFEPTGLVITLIICAALISYGYFKRPQF